MNLLEQIRERFGDHALVMWDQANVNLYSDCQPFGAMQVGLGFGDPTSYASRIVMSNGRFIAGWTGDRWLVRRLGRPGDRYMCPENEDSDAFRDRVNEEASGRRLSAAERLYEECG